MLYSLIRKILFQCNPERAHHMALNLINLMHQIHLTKPLFPTIKDPVTCLGMQFPNRIGLSAGFDRNGDYLAALGSLGFGFLEMGTVIPKVQFGNPRPRIFRLPRYEALINRMGFASLGMEHAVSALEKTTYRGILGINIGKSKDTPLENALDDYLLGFRTLAKFASYITINISSPNTAGLRNLLKLDYLTGLLISLKTEQAKYSQFENKYVPIVIKISPDLSTEEIEQVADALLLQQLDGVIASNTTISRESVEDDPCAKESGGLSGRPLLTKNLQVIHTLSQKLNGRIPIIASGGITDETAAQKVIKTGAQLIEIYTGLIYQGPGLINRLVKAVKGLPSSTETVLHQ